MVIGTPLPRSVVSLTSADPRSSVLSVARVSAAMIRSALPTALSTVSAVFFVVSALHAEVTTRAAAVNPTQAAVCRSFIVPTPSCVSVVRRDFNGAHRHCRDRMGREGVNVRVSVYAGALRERSREVPCPHRARPVVLAARAAVHGEDDGTCAVV